MIFALAFQITRKNWVPFAAFPAQRLPFRHAAMKLQAHIAPKMAFQVCVLAVIKMEIPATAALFQSPFI